MHKRILFAALVAAVAVVCPAHATVPTTASTTTATGNGTTTAFATTFTFQKATDLLVTVAGVTKTLNSDYTVSGAGNATGTVTFTVAPANLAAVVISRVVDLKQTVSFRQNRTFDPTTVESAIDRLAMGLQQLNNGAVTQTLSTPLSSTQIQNTTGGTGAVARTGDSKFADTLSLADFGGKCDGSTDDTTAITNAKAQAAATYAALIFRGSVNTGVCKNTGVQGDIQSGSMMFPGLSQILFIDRRIRPIMPAQTGDARSYPTGNDLQFESYGPADIWLRNRSIQGNANSISAGTGASGTTTTVVVGGFTSSDCSAPPCDGTGGTHNGQLNGTATTILSPPTSPTLNVIEIEPDTANAESLGASHWAIVDATHIQIINPTLSHTPPYVVRQRGATHLDTHFLTTDGDGVSDHPIHVRDLSGVEYLALPNDTAGTWPKKGLQFTGLLTGLNGANSNLIYRNATAASNFKWQNFAGNDRMLWGEDGSGNGTLQLTGYMGIGATPSSSVGMLVKPNATLTGTSQTGTQSTPTCSTAATIECDGVAARGDTAAGAYTQTNNASLHAQDTASKGAGMTITNKYGVLVDDISTGSNNWAIKTGLGTVEFGGNLILHGSVTFAGAQTDSNFSAYRATKATPAATIIFGQTKVSLASTLTADSYIIPDVVGVGPGSFIARLCSDGTTCGAGNIYLTCTLSCTGAVGTPVACTVTKSAVAAATTLSWEVGTACATTDPGVNVNAHYTTP